MEEESVMFSYLSTDEMPADMLKKAFARVKFKKFRGLLSRKTNGLKMVGNMPEREC